MSNRFKYYLLFLLILGVQHFALAQRVTAKLDSSSMRIGQQTMLRVFVNAPKNAAVSFPNFKDTITTNVLIRPDKTDTLQDDKSAAMHTIRRNYVITAFDAGSYTIPSIKVKVGNDSLATAPVPLDITSVKVDTTKAFYDIKQPIAVKYTILDWLRDNLLWIIIGFWLLSLIVGIIFVLIKRPKTAPKAVEAPKPLVAPHVAAAAKLDALRDKKLWQMDFFKEYHSELTDIVREYIELRFSISTFEKTTDEILSGLRTARLSEEDRRRLQQLFTLADLVKFAKERPIAADNEQSMADALAFVKSTGKETNLEEGGTNGVA